MIAPIHVRQKRSELNSRRILASVGKDVKAVAFPKEQAVFAQGDAAGTVFYIQEGKVRLTVVSEFGKEVTLSILSEGEFFGDGGLAGQSLRMGSATAMTDCKFVQIDVKAMMLALQRDRTLSDLYVAYLLARNLQYHEALVDQFFDPCEKRIARVLLLLARFGKEGNSETVIPEVSQEALANMAGTTRLRVSFFMDQVQKIRVSCL